MPLLDRQRRGVVLGSIRIGIKVTATRQNGSTYQRPEKLSTFRLTSPDRNKVEAAAALYGGEVTEWTADDRGGKQWQVVTERDTLAVRVPPGEPVHQMYEMWAGRPVVRQRLCDGFQEKMKGGTCVCPPDLLERGRLAKEGGACKPTTRLSLILADLPGLGVWTLTSTGDSAADELGNTAELLRASAARGVMLPATLRLEQRESRGSGQVHHYAVPVLDVGASLAALEAGHLPVAQLEAPRQPALAAGQGAAAAPASLAGGAAPPVQETPPRDAQTCADRARHAPSVDAVKRLGAYARERGWMEQYVTDAEGVDEPLENALYAALERVGGLG